MRIKQVHRPFWDWEEVAYNMWGEVGDKKEWFGLAVEFTGDHEIYGYFMRRVVREWPVSCENALTDPHLNRKAWVGHAACALAFRCPEDIVREAWKGLRYEQKFLANKEAERAIAIWERHYVQDKGLCQYVGDPMLFGWDTG